MKVGHQHSNSEASHLNITLLTVCLGYVFVCAHRDQQITPRIRILDYGF